MLLTTSLHAQWLTQSFALKSGWNAVYIHVDASHATINDLIGDGANPIQEIWMWSPNPTAAQFITDPQSPSQPTYWLNWSRTASPSATLERLPGNVACLVRSAIDTVWTLKGKPLAPVYHWSSSGLNFFGFPTVPASPPTFDTFFGPAPDLKVGAEIFAYRGGPISDNPVQIFDLATRNAKRGEAFWIRSESANRYFGPFEVVASSSAGVRFGDSLGQVRLRIRNTTPQELTVTLTSVLTETPPQGQSAIQGPVPVLVRGEINITNLTYSHAALASGPQQWTLKRKGQVGSEAELVLGVDRQQISGTADDLYASVLRFTDSLNHTQIDVPVSAEVGSLAGLWVGGASVSSVNHYLNKYAKAENETELAAVLVRLGLAEGTNGYHYEIDPSTKRVMVFGGPENKIGAYLLDGAARVDEGAVARPFPLRLILHNDGSTARLLQRVYYGIGLATNSVVATRESLLLPDQLASARRISAAHLPATAANTPWNFAGAMRLGTNLTTTVLVGFANHDSNPFLHTYHPDHDNLDSSFESPLPQGSESYSVRREITLTFTAPPGNFESLTRGSATMFGTYAEVVTFLGKPDAQRSYTVRGAFALNQIADTAVLTQ